MPRIGYEIQPDIRAKKLFDTPSQLGATRTGGHRPEGIFMAYGPDIRGGLWFSNVVNTWDITPTLLHMLGLPILKEMDGNVLMKIFKKNSAPAKRRVKMSG